MDGRNKTRLMTLRLRYAVCSFVAIASLQLVGQVAAETPPLFELQGVPQPISRPLTTPAQLERSPLDKPSVMRPSLLKPRARVLSVSQTPVIAVLAGTSNADSGSPAQTISAPGDLRSAVPNSAIPVAQKAPAARLTVEEALESKGSVTFRKTPLSEVVFLLSDLWHINIVAGENVSGEVSGAFHDAPLREVLSASLAAAGYSYRQTGSSLVVLPIDQVGADDPNFVSDTIQLPSTLAHDDATLEAAQLLLSDRGQMRKVGDHAVLVVDTAKRIARIRQLFTDLTPGQASVDSTSTGHAPSEQSLAGTASTPEFVQSGIAYFSPQFTEAEEMSEPLREALGESVIVAVYPEENRIMVKGAADDLRLASEAIRQLDRPRPQVRITAMIYDVGLKEIERLGIDWSVRPHSSSLALSDLNDPESLRFRNLFSATTGFIKDPAAAGAANFAVSSINDAIDVDALLQALDSSSEAKLLADPSITVADRYEASIRIVQKIPIVAADPVENSGVVFSQVDFEEAGVILNVQPRISRDGTVELIVQPEYSVVVDFINNNPVIDSRTAQTTVRVADGQMFALGGLRQKTIVETVRGVPGLRNIKYIGKLFQAHDTEVRESELIVFLKPEVITPYSPGTLRQQHAGYVGTEQLDAIAHAESVPATPSCQDHHCPNHYPRPRLNGGSRSLEISLEMMGGSGMIPVEQYGAQDIEIVDEYSHETTEQIQQDNISQQAAPDRSPNVVIHEVYPPIHIDPRASQ